MDKGMVATVEDVSKSYGKETVLHPTSLSIEAGECLVICGGNGAGKSTLIKIMTGILKPSTGKVTFPASKGRAFGYMPDHMQYHPELTPLETLAYYAGFIQTSQDAIDATLHRVGLWDVRNKKVGSFSKGMAQRVNLAQALLTEAPLYIFDEPTNGLDPFWAIQFKEIVRELKRDGKAVLLTSHVMNDAVELGDRLMIMFEGRVRAEGEAKEICRMHGCETLEQLFLLLVAK